MATCRSTTSEVQSWTDAEHPRERAEIGQGAKHRQGSDRGRSVGKAVPSPYQVSRIDRGGANTGRREPINRGSRQLNQYRLPQG